MHKHVIVVDRKVVERGVRVDANHRLDVVIRRVGDAVAVVRVALAHNEPTWGGSFFRNSAMVVATAYTSASTSAKCGGGDGCGCGRGRERLTRRCPVR